MPKRSHVQQLEVLETDEAREEAELRELVRDGTSDSASESSSSESSSSWTWLNLAESWSRLAEAMMCLVWPGLNGWGETMRVGETGRPLAMPEEELRE